MSRPGWLTVALGCAVGFFLGVVLVVGLGGPSNEPEARPAPRARPALPQAPNVLGASLDQARAELEQAGYGLEVAAGGGLFGPVIEELWTVVDQDPDAGTPLRRGATIRVAVER
jgi:hypothetical protein